MRTFDKQDIKRTMYDKTETPNGNENEIGILSLTALAAQYRFGEFQLFRIKAGFGAYPDKMGNAIYGEFCIDGEHARFERYQFIGIANDETKEIAEQLEKKKKVSDKTSKEKK